MVLPRHNIHILLLRLGPRVLATSPLFVSFLMFFKSMPVLLVNLTTYILMTNFDDQSMNSALDTPSLRCYYVTKYTLSLSSVYLETYDYFELTALLNRRYWLAEPSPLN